MSILGPRSVPSVALPFVLVLSAGFLWAGCAAQGEGARCNFDNGNDDCEEGLICKSSRDLGGNADICCPPGDTSESPECIPGGGATSTTATTTTSTSTSTTSTTTTSTTSTSSTGGGGQGGAGGSGGQGGATGTGGAGGQGGQGGN